MIYDLRFKNSFIFGLILIVLIALDQFSKYIIRHSGGFYICNQNIAFGIPVPSFIFWIFWIIIISCILGIFVRKNGNSIALILIIAGAFSNAYNKLTSGCIIDFIKIPGWPSFNLADIYITLGAVIFICSMMIKKEKSAGEGG